MVRKVGRRPTPRPAVRITAQQHNLTEERAIMSLIPTGRTPQAAGGIVIRPRPESPIPDWALGSTNPDSGSSSSQSSASPPSQVLSALALAGPARYGLISNSPPRVEVPITSLKPGRAPREGAAAAMGYDLVPRDVPADAPEPRRYWWSAKPKPKPVEEDWEEIEEEDGELEVVGPLELDKDDKPTYAAVLRPT